MMVATMMWRLRYSRPVAIRLGRDGLRPPHGRTASDPEKDDYREMSFPHVMSPLQASLSLLTIRFLHSPAFDLGLLSHQWVRTKNVFGWAPLR
jgi:hypothetical protein